MDLLVSGQPISSDEVNPEEYLNKNENDKESESKNEEKKPKEKKSKRINPPKDSKTFFKARGKIPHLYTFTKDGNLQVPATEKGPAKIIELPFYKSITVEERFQKEQENLAELTALEKEFDETLGLLRDAIVEWRETGAITKVGEYQDKLQMIDSKRSILRSGKRWTKQYDGVKINKIDFSNRYEQRKVPYPVATLRMRQFAPNVEIIPTTNNPFAQKQQEEEEEEEAEQQVQLTLEENEEDEEEEEIIFFNEPEQVNGFLSPDTMTKFIYNGVEYNSLIQAYHGIRLERVGRKQMRPLLLNETSPKSIRNFASKVTGDIEDPRKVLIEILKKYVAYYPDIKEQLRETGTTTIAYADPKDVKWGIGLAIEDPERENRSAWTGQNILGEAWMTVRSQLNSIEEEKMEGGGITEVAKTLEDVKRRSGVLINSYKMKNLH
jgi:predicted NAD-dependent protein-ADP-ribosyltransferase YbiA (DUF1768 family)